MIDLHKKTYLSGRKVNPKLINSQAIAETERILSAYTQPRRNPVKDNTVKFSSNLVVGSSERNAGDYKRYVKANPKGPISHDFVHIA